jgi:chaperonin GroES
MKVVPLHDNVLVKRDEVEEKKTPGGIFIPTQGQKAPCTCTVISVGPACSFAEFEVSEGIRVVVSTFAGVDIEVDNEKLIMVKEEDILGVVEES